MFLFALPIDNINNENVQQTKQIHQQIEQTSYDKSTVQGKNENSYLSIQGKSAIYFIVIFGLILYLLSFKRRITDNKIKTILYYIILLQLLLVLIGFFMSVNFNNALIEIVLIYIFYIPVISLPVLFTIAVFKCINMFSKKKHALVYMVVALLLCMYFGAVVALSKNIMQHFNISLIFTVAIVFFIELCIHSRIFQSSSGYHKFFKNSCLAMKIKDKTHKTVNRSLTAKNINTNYIKRETKIAGGSFIYFEDHSSLIFAQRKLAGVNEELRKNHDFLLQNSKVNENLVALATERKVYESIDNVLLAGTKKIEKLIEHMRDTSYDKKIMKKISILACIMKRECMFRINVLYQDKQPVGIFFNALLELKSFAASNNVTLTVRCEFVGDLKTQQALLMYMFFANGIEKTIDSDCKNFIAQLYERENDIVFSVMADKSIFDDKYVKHFNKTNENCKLVHKKWEETESYLLTFKQEAQND